MGIERRRRRAWNEGGMRMVYTEFLYSFLHDFLIINGVENNKLSGSWVYILMKSQPSAKELTEKKVDQGKAIIETTSP